MSGLRNGSSHRLLRLANTTTLCRPTLAILLGTPPLTHRSRCRQRRAPGAPPHWRSVRELSILHPIESRLSRVKISIPTLTARACRHTSLLNSRSVFLSASQLYSLIQWSQVGRESLRLGPRRKPGNGRHGR